MALQVVWRNPYYPSAPAVNDMELVEPDRGMPIYILHRANSEVIFRSAYGEIRRLSERMLEVDDSW